MCNIATFHKDVFNKERSREMIIKYEVNNIYNKYSVII